MPSLEVADAKRQFDDLLERVSRGEEVIITKNDRPLARLTPPVSSQDRKQRQFGRVEGEIWMSDDFDEPLDDFEEYV